MPFIFSLTRVIDAITHFIGRALAWLTLLMMILLALVVFLRYGLHIGSVAMQEVVTYLHASVFMLGIAYTLQRDSHVRVDIFYQHFSARRKAWINSLGAIVFVLPLCVYIGFSSIDFVAQSWSIREGSAEPGGIPGVFLLKSLIPLLAAMLALQAFAEILRNAVILMSDKNG